VAAESESSDFWNARSGLAREQGLEAFDGYRLVCRKLRRVSFRNLQASVDSSAHDMKFETESAIVRPRQRVCFAFLSDGNLASHSRNRLSIQ